jgi:hypothetical protein
LALCCRYVFISFKLRISNKFGSLFQTNFFLTLKKSDQRCAGLDLKPRLLGHYVWLGHFFEAVTLPYLLLIRRFHRFTDYPSKSKRDSSSHSNPLLVTKPPLLTKCALDLQSLAPINPHWARVVGFGPFSICVIIHKDYGCIRKVCAPAVRTLIG